jgi:hypothetical protein
LLPDDEEAPVDWDWVAETALDIGGTFTFARGASPGQVMTAFGMNPAKARLVPASDVAQALHDPDWLRTEPPEHPWIRVGIAGEGGFALDERWCSTRTPVTTWHHHTARSAAMSRLATLCALCISFRCIDSIYRHGDAWRAVAKPREA